jgi:hypothetical protein
LLKVIAKGSPVGLLWLQLMLPISQVFKETIGVISHMFSSKGRIINYRLFLKIKNKNSSILTSDQIILIINF